MEKLRYILFAVFIYTAITQGPMMWKRLQVERLILSQGGIKKFAVPASCKDKKYCLTVYVSVTDPNSKQSEISLFAFQKFLPRIRSDMGFGVVIGDGKSGDLEAAREHLSQFDHYVDETGVIFLRRKIERFPTWILTNSEGEEIKRVTAFQNVADFAGVNQILNSYFKL